MAAAGGGRGKHREAMAALACISSVTLLAALALVSSGTSKVGLFQGQPMVAPVIDSRELAMAPAFWKTSMLHSEERVVAKNLAADMRKLWAAQKSRKNKDNNKVEKQELSDLKKVELAKKRYDTLAAIINEAPVLRRMNSDKPHEVLAQDPRTGQIFVLYEYHVPGGYLGGDNGVDSDYDAVTAPSEYYSSAEKGDAPFTWSIDRNPIYQGEPNNYAGGEWFNMRSGPARLRAPVAQNLYEYHVPGGYLGGDNGVDSDYDAVTAPSEYFATDEKGDGAFEEPAGRDPVYQGEYHDYAGGDWTNMKATPQSLAAVPYMMSQPVNADVAVMRDGAGRLRLVNLAAVEGLERAELARAAARNRMALQLMARRLARKNSAAKVNHKAKPAAAASQKVPVKEVKKAAQPEVKKSTAKKSQTQMLADASWGSSSSTRTWGKVYNPKLVTLPNTDNANKEKPLSSRAEKEFQRWNKLAQKVTDVYDPMSEHSSNIKLSLGKHDNW
ncbi:hypothetical protein GUITHDRAFT_164897, partial [Guillardia theta CCMP2712]